MAFIRGPADAMAALWGVAVPALRFDGGARRTTGPCSFHATLGVSVDAPTCTHGSGAAVLAGLPWGVALDRRFLAGRRFRRFEPTVGIHRRRLRMSWERASSPSVWGLKEALESSGLEGKFMLQPRTQTTVAQRRQAISSLRGGRSRERVFRRRGVKETGVTSSRRPTRGQDGGRSPFVATSAQGRSQVVRLGPRYNHPNDDFKGPTE